MRAETTSGARLVLVLGGLASFGPLSIDMYLPALPALSHGLSASASSVQLTLTAFLVGLAVGQLVVGPLSDRLGRRRPLRLGLGLYVVASLACAAAPTIEVLIGARLLQGMAGAAGVVTSRAVVRDLHAGAAAARLFSLLMLVNGLAPILAPVVGGQVLRATSWRGVFVILAALGALLLTAASFGLRETLPPERRRGGGPLEVLRTMRGVLRDRLFVGYALALGFGAGAMFAYIAASPFVLEDIHHVSPQLYGVVFGLNAVGLVAASQVNARLVGRIAPRRLLTHALAVSAAAALGLLAAVAAGGGLEGILPALALLVTSFGFVMPNATALALTEQGKVAGSAAAVLGVLQYAVGAAAAPLVGLAGERTAVPMAAVIATLACGALLAVHAVARPRAAAAP